MQPTDLLPQGVPVLQDAEVGQEFVDLEDVFSKGCGDVGLLHLSKLADGGFADVGEVLRTLYRMDHWSNLIRAKQVPSSSCLRAE